MKKERMTAMLNAVGIPATITALGVILVVKPDSATVLAAKIIAWLLVIGGAVKAISMANRRGRSTTGGWIIAAVCVIFGVVILKNPLILAEGIGRFLGLLLVGRGANDLRRSNQRKARILAVITLAAGAVLFLVPMTLTRTLLRLCGIVAAVIGIFNIVEKLQEVKLLEAGKDSNIIDADE